MDIFSFLNLKRKKRKTIGIALSSGGAKGIAHINVLEFLDEHDVKIDYIAGSSIGALVGAIYLSGTLTQFRDELASFSWRKIIKLVDPVFPRSGIIAGNKIVTFLSRFIDPKINIEDLPAKLAIVATDYYTGNPVVYTSGNLLQAVRGSISIPGVFVPHPYNGKVLIDGGVANPMPVDIVRAMGAQKIVAVNLHPSAKLLPVKKSVREKLAFKKKQRSMGDRIASHTKINAERWFRFAAKILDLDNKAEVSATEELPSIIDVFMQSMEVMEYMNTHALLSYNKPTVLIEPEVREISGLDFDSAKKVLEIGAAAVKKKRRILMRKIVT